MKETAGHSQVAQWKGGLSSLRKAGTEADSLRPRVVGQQVGQQQLLSAALSA